MENKIIFFLKKLRVTTALSSLNVPIGGKKILQTGAAYFVHTRAKGGGTNWYH